MSTDVFAERLNLSTDQQKYIDNSEPSEDLLVFENVVLPFTNLIPKTTELSATYSLKN